MEELFLKPIIVSTNDMDRFEQWKRGEEGNTCQNTWHDWLINYISEPKIPQRNQTLLEENSNWSPTIWHMKNLINNCN